MKEITLETKIADLLNDYEGMKEILIKINPKFKKLNNPVLRRTLAKVAGVKQAAIVGGMDPMDLLNQLRKAVGQTPIDLNMDETQKKGQEENHDVPQWISIPPKQKLNANTLLDEERNPLAELHKALKSIENEEVITIESDFRPEPLIDEMKKANHEVFVEEKKPDHFITYIKK